MSSDWHHAPVHRLEMQGAYIVTTGTYGEAPLFRGEERLALLRDRLLTTASEYGWVLEAWAVFPNHYHFVGLSPEDAGMLRRVVSKMHTLTAREINRQDATKGRRVWCDYWETDITNQPSYYARLNYAHSNAVHHGIVPEATQYRWCSAGWFERTADGALRRMVAGFKTDRVKVLDDF